jgi:hypothetical protein
VAEQKDWCNPSVLEKTSDASRRAVAMQTAPRRTRAATALTDPQRSSASLDARRKKRPAATAYFFGGLNRSVDAAFDGLPYLPRVQWQQ